MTLRLSYSVRRANVAELARPHESVLILPQRMFRIWVSKLLLEGADAAPAPCSSASRDQARHEKQGRRRPAQRLTVGDGVFWSNTNRQLPFSNAKVSASQLTRDCRLPAASFAV